MMPASLQRKWKSGRGLHGLQNLSAPPCPPENAPASWRCVQSSAALDFATIQPGRVKRIALMTNDELNPTAEGRTRRPNPAFRHSGFGFLSDLVPALRDHSSLATSFRVEFGGGFA